MLEFFNKKRLHFLALLIFVLFSVFNFYPVFEGKQLNFAERNQGMSKEMLDYEKETGKVTRWTNAMFSGMPTYYIMNKAPKDAVEYVRKYIGLGFPKEAGNFLMGMIFFYILMMTLGVSPWIGIFASLSFAFATNNMILLDTGHFTKLRTILSAPLILSGLILTFRKNYILGSLIFTLALSINIKYDHPQMTYYLGLSLLPMVFIYLYSFYKKGELKEFFMIGCFLIAGLLLSVATTASKILPVKEYTEDTMRGKAVLEQAGSSFSSSSVDGLSWDYAMSWSNGTIDLLQGFISHSVGGSTGEMLPSDSNFAKELRKFGASTRGGVQAPVYWGDLPSTSGPIYFGAVVCCLFLISLFVLKGYVRWWVLAAVVLTSLISLGKNFEIFNRLLYDFFPYFNKFRTPNSVLSVTTIFMPLLGFYGLHKLLEEKPDWKKAVYPGLALAGLCALFAFLAPSFFDMTGAYDARYAQSGLDVDVLLKDRADMAFQSGMRSAVYMLLSCLFIYLALKNKMKSIYALTFIGVLSLIDLFSVNFKYVKPSDYITDAALKRTYQPRQVDKEILSDPDRYYRVLDMSVPTFESAFTSYFHKSIGGYHPAKLVRYQDIIDYHISNNNMAVLNMLNAKYIIAPGDDGGERVQRNTAALGNAWFVSNIQMVNSNKEEIDALGDFDPLATAFVHQEFADKVSRNAFDKNGSIELKDYAPDRLVYNSQSTSDQFAVFSEIWYGPNKGWKASIDGVPAEHIRANYVLRAMNIPAGNHEIVFEFDPDSLKSGTLISRVSSIIIVLLLLLYLYNLSRPEDKRWIKMA